MGLDEKDTYILSNEEIKKIDKKYKKYFEKWNEYSSDELVEKSHNNLAWIKARKEIDPDCPSEEILEENEDFLKFKNENN